MTTELLLSYLPSSYAIHSNGSVYNTDGDDSEGTDYSIEIDGDTMTVSCTGFTESVQSIEELLDLIA